MEVGFFFPPTTGNQEELFQGLAGQRSDLYQRMLVDLTELAQCCDEHGYYGLAFTEHHLSIEGMTTSNNPALLNVYLGLKTRRIRHGALGYVLPAHNPLRVAEDIAMVDQMTQGRAFAGFARGIQARWLNVFGQHYPGIADNLTDPEGYTRAKRELYDEHLEIILKAWGNETFSHHGKHWQIPPPNIAWPPKQYTREMGRGLDADGRLTEVGIAPRTFQRPGPPMFEPFSISEASIELAASRGIVPVGIVTDPGLVGAQIDAAQRGWAQHGVQKKRGEGIGFARYMVVADTDAEALAIAEQAMFEWKYFFSMFGFNIVIGRAGERPEDIPNNVQAYIERQLLFCGSPTTVCRQFEAAFGRNPVEYLWLFTSNELVSQRALLRSIELMATKVLPHFTDRVN